MKMVGPYCHKVLPAAFDDSLSYYEQVCRLTQKVNETIGQFNGLQEQIDAINSHLADVDADLSSLNADLMALDSKVEGYYSELTGYIAELYRLIEELGHGQPQWDPQIGEFTDTTTAQRDMFNDVTVHGITVKDLDSLDFTVATLSDCGLNARGLAVMGQWLIETFPLPHYFTDIALEE